MIKKKDDVADSIQLIEYLCETSASLKRNSSIMKLSSAVHAERNPARRRRKVYANEAGIKAEPRRPLIKSGGGGADNFSLYRIFRRKEF